MMNADPRRPDARDAARAAVRALSTTPDLAPGDFYVTPGDITAADRADWDEARKILAREVTGAPRHARPSDDQSGRLAPSDKDVKAGLEYLHSAPAPTQRAIMDACAPAGDSVTDAAIRAASMLARDADASIEHVCRIAVRVTRRWSDLNAAAARYAGPVLTSTGDLIELESAITKQSSTGDPQLRYGYSAIDLDRMAVKLYRLKGSSARLDDVLRAASAVAARLGAAEDKIENARIDATALVWTSKGQNVANQRIRNAERGLERLITRLQAEQAEARRLLTPAREAVMHGWTGPTAHGHIRRSRARSVDRSALTPGYRPRPAAALPRLVGPNQTLADARRGNLVPFTTLRDVTRA